MRATILIASLALLASVMPANAQAVSCVRSRNTLDCNFYMPEPGGATIRHAPAMTETAIEHDQLWVIRCQPIVKFDKAGIPRYTYNGKQGCASGQWSD